jgi:glutamyl-tRNA reductase
LDFDLPAISLSPVDSPSAAATASLAPHDRQTLVQPLSLVGFEYSLDTGSLDSLESVTRTITVARVDEWFSRFRRTEEIGLFSTCHRMEVILLVRELEEVERWRQILPGAPSRWEHREGRELARHLVSVAAGRESLAFGEIEVREQLRAAARLIRSRHPRPVLRKMYDGAADAADELSPRGSSACSIAAIASEKLLALVGQASPRVLVVGAGTVGLQVARRLGRSAQVTIAYHERPPEALDLEATGARSIPLPQIPAELPSTDAIVTAAKFGDRGLGIADLPAHRPLLLLDLGMPRNIDPAVRELPNVRLVDLGELHAEVRRVPRPDGDALRVHAFADRLFDQLAPLLLEPWIDLVRNAAEALRQAELANARPYLGNLDPDQEVAIERLTRRLVARLLIAPTERVRSLPSGPEGDLPRQIALEILRPLPGAP